MAYTKDRSGSTRECVGGLTFKFSQAALKSDDDDDDYQLSSEPGSFAAFERPRTISHASSGPHVSSETMSSYYSRSSSNASACTAASSHVSSHLSSRGSNVVPNVSSDSDAPSAHSALDSFEQYLLENGHHMRGEAVESQGSTTATLLLPCDFRWLTGCPYTFGPEEVEQCIEHIGRDHLHHRFPPESWCWWCDDFRFVSGTDEEHDAGREARKPSKTGKTSKTGKSSSAYHQHPRHPQTVGSSGSASRAFADRMHHIAHHVFWEGYSPFACPPRPDFPFLDHLWRHGVIDRNVFERQKSRKEVPRPEGVRDAGWMPEVPGREAQVLKEISRAEERARRKERGEKERRGRKSKA